MMIKWNYYLVKEYINKEGYVLLSTEYTKIHDKLKIKCPNGHIFEMSFNNFKKGQRCKECARLNKQKYSKEEVEMLLSREGYVLNSEYKNIRDNIEMICPNGHTTNMSFASFENGHRCKHCKETDKNRNLEGFKTNNKKFNKGNKKYTLDEARNILKEVGFELLDEEYNGIKSQVNIRCEHGHEVNMRFDKARNGKCPQCSKENSFYSLDFIKDYLSKDGYSLLSTEYNGIYENIEIMCDKGHIYTTTFNNYKNYGFRCPICKGSLGERKIEKYLTENNIKYIYQYKIEDCKDKKALPFDFYLPDYNLIIEYDGEQHYDIKHTLGGEESFWLNVVHDAIKNAYCEDNNINLLRKPFWKLNNIEKIIKETLNNLL